MIVFKNMLIWNNHLLKVDEKPKINLRKKYKIFEYKVQNIFSIPKFNSKKKFKIWKNVMSK